MVQTVEECVMIGRRMFVTPGDTTVMVDLLPAANFQSFRLDDTALGVLDQNRLGCCCRGRGRCCFTCLSVGMSLIVGHVNG